MLVIRVTCRLTSYFCQHKCDANGKLWSFVAACKKTAAKFQT
jgi:hypothetical protein